MTDRDATTAYRDLGNRFQRGRALRRLPPQQGRVALVTGGTDGVGRAVAQQLAVTGATTLLSARNGDKGHRVRDEIRMATGNDDVHVVPLDLIDLCSVDAAADIVLRDWDRLDLLVTNAGVAAPKRRAETLDGFEFTLGVNHIAHAALIDRLTDRLRASAPSRVVIVASEAHARSRGGLDFDDLMLETDYRRSVAYARSKLANILHARELARRLSGSGVTVFAVHPGSVDTPMMRQNFHGNVGEIAYRLLRRFLLITPEEAAAALLTVALDPALAGTTGTYHEVGIEKQPKATVRDDDARRLWDVTQSLLESAKRRH